MRTVITNPSMFWAPKQTILTAHLFKSQKKAQRRKTLPFTASIQHVKNIDLMLQCDECGLWRLLYSKQKLSGKECEDLQRILEDYSFTCGAPLQDLELAGRLANVYSRDLACYQPIEKLYYTAKYDTAKYDPICVYCAEPVESSPNSECYPQCQGCQEKPPIKIINSVYLFPVWCLQTAKMCIFTQ